MLEIKGKYCRDLKVFTDDIEETALSTLYRIADMNPYDGARIRVMPDVHQGAGDSVIGFSVPITIDGGMVSPKVVGCDLGCTVSLAFFDKPMPSDKIAEFEHKIRQQLPFGADINDDVTYNEKELLSRFNKAMDKLVSMYPIFKDYVYDHFTDDRDITKWLSKFHMDEVKFYKSLPSCGSGNHFVEYDENTELGKYAVCVHCGSRNLGQRVFKYYDDLASNGKIPKEVARAITAEVKARNTDRRMLAKEIEEDKARYMDGKVKDFISCDDMMHYLVDVLLCQEYARFNHELIHRLVGSIYAKLCGGVEVERIVTTHNYIDYDFEALDGTPHMMVRKGAVRSYRGERLVIPFNMRDGIAVCEGKSNEDWNWTAPHGCGRSLSRSKAKERLNIEDFKATMEAAGVYTTTADKDTIDEAPMAYKPKDEIIKLIEPTCDVLFFMHPRMNIKGSDVFQFVKKKA